MNDKEMRILVIDAGVRHAVDIIRSLGRRGIHVSIVVKDKRAPASYSRYVAETHQFPLDANNMEPSIDFLESMLRQGRYDAVLSAGLDGFRILSCGLDRLSAHAGVPVSAWPLFAVAEDKADTTLLAERIGVPVPTTYYPTGLDDLDNYQDVPFPVVVKARRGQGHFAYAGNFQELREVVYPQICARVEDQLAEGVFPILQEFIKGKGHGFYALMNHGELKAYFMHERIHEVPPTGGPSAMAKSYYNEELIAVGSRMLQALKWHGVAMVEFKKDVKDGLYKLIEINPKFWGSLGLSVAAGVDFPYLQTRMAVDGDIEPVEMPRDPITYQWLSMDIAHSIAVKKPLMWLGYVLKGTPNDFRLSDPMPNLALLWQGARDVLGGKRNVHSTGAEIVAGNLADQSR